MHGTPSSQVGQHRQDRKKREGGATLGKNQRIDGTQSVQAGELSGKGSPSQAGADAPTKCGRSDIQIAARGFTNLTLQSCSPGMRRRVSLGCAGTCTSRLSISGCLYWARDGSARGTTPGTPA